MVTGAIFSRRWLLITHKSRLPNPGDYVRYNIANYDVVISKDRSGKIHSFHNVCRHRAYPVVESDQGNAKIFSCRYHGWSYGLSGNLAKAPAYQDFQHFDKSEFLTRLSMEELTLIRKITGQHKLRMPLREWGVCQ